jgi:DNA-binding FadR family transcriptional regulator
MKLAIWSDVDRIPEFRWSMDDTAGVLIRGKKPTKRKALTGVLTALVDSVVSGEFREGDLLPVEESLLARFKVSRTTLREALQHMVAFGLIRATPRAGTSVQPRNSWNLLDPVVLASALRHNRDRSFYESLADARALMEPEAARLAAQFASPRSVAAIGNAFADMVESEGRDTEAWSMADLAFHSAIMEASDNWVYRQFIVAIRAALLASFKITNRASQSHDDAIQLHRRVYEAIAGRKPEDARIAMRQLIDRAREDMSRAMTGAFDADAQFGLAR